MQTNLFEIECIFNTYIDYLLNIFIVKSHVALRLHPYSAMISAIKNIRSNIKTTSTKSSCFLSSGYKYILIKQITSTNGIEFQVISLFGFECNGSCIGNVLLSLDLLPRPIICIRLVCFCLYIALIEQ